MPATHFPHASGWPSLDFSLMNGADSYKLCRAESLQSSGGILLQHGSSSMNLSDMKQRVTWTEQEDELLRELIGKYGTTKWSLIASKIPFKTNRHCRRRWQACMNANGNKGAWTPEEDAKLIQGHKMYGNRWTEIAKLVPGRTDNAAKNRFVAITKGNPSLLEKASEKLISHSSTVSGTESGLTAEASRTSSEPASGCSSRKAAPCSEAEDSPNKRRCLRLDLNADAHAASDSESDGSALVFEAEEGSDSCRYSFSKKSGRFWLDLNAPCNGSLDA